MPDTSQTDGCALCGRVTGPSSVEADVERRVRDARGAGRLPVVVGEDGRAEGVVVLGDRPRDGWRDALADLRDRGVDVVVLTGDDRSAAAEFRDHPAVDHVLAGVPPEGKTAAVRRLQGDAHVTMVGDGTNDAPALAAADLGVAVGGGTALAAEAADVALAADDLAAVGLAFDVADAARDRLRRSHRLALLYNLVAVPAALLGLLNPLVTTTAAVVMGGLVALHATRERVEG